MPTFTVKQDQESLPEMEQKLAHWMGMLGGPAAWFLQLNVSYALIQLACHTGRTWPLHVSTIFFLALAAAAGVVAAHDWRHPEARGTSDEHAMKRTRFMGIVGVFLSSIFFVLILVQGIASFIFSPCEVGV